MAGPTDARDHPKDNPNMEPLKRWSVPGLPFLLSAVLSLSTVGTHVYWQDSGFYLTAVREMGVLYPHGFVVYQVLCKAWTSLLFFVDFTLAVHLFSALCAALAAGTVALAARDFLDGKGNVAATLTGCVVAAGYTFWFSGIYAKVYALLYFVLALLMWAIVRTAKSPTTAGTRTVAALAGLGWAVHPSVALGGLALAGYFLLTARTLGWKPVALSLLLGLVVALAPGALLPVLSSRDVETSMGQPRSAGQVFSYLLGSRFTGIPGVFGIERSRVAALGIFLWEEYLGVGLLLLALGAWTLHRSRPRTIGAGLLWTLPYLGVATLFKIEGQGDHWGVAACFPFSLAIAAGLHALGTGVPRPQLVQVGVAGAGILWSIAANGADLNLRNDDLPETYGRLYLQNLEPDAVLLAHTDDVIATTWALQTVKNVRRDVVLVNASQLGAEEIWYDRCLQRHHPDLRLPSSIPESKGRQVRDSDPLVSAFIGANIGGRRPLYVTSPLVPELLPPGHLLVPRGVLWQVVPAGEDQVRPEFWKFPLEPEDVSRLFRRKRGLAVTLGPGGFEVEFEPYERRLQKALLKARTLLADWQFRHGQPAPALRLYESVLALDPGAGKNETFLHGMALCALAVGRPDQASFLFQRLLELPVRPWVRASSWLGLGDIAKARGNGARARGCYEEAAKVTGLAPEQQAAVRERLGRP